MILGRLRYLAKNLTIPYGGLEVADAARLKDLERENARLKKLLAERDLEIEVMKEINAKKW